MASLAVDSLAPLSSSDLEKRFNTIPLVLPYKEYLNIYINLTQLWQEHDQHIE